MLVPVAGIRHDETHEEMEDIETVCTCKGYVKSMANSSRAGVVCIRDGFLAVLGFSLFAEIGSDVSEAYESGRWGS